MPDVTVIVPTRNAPAARLRRVLAAIIAAGEDADWEGIVVDNAATRAIESLPGRFRVVHEPMTGLTPARLAGARSAAGGVLVFFDDDNLPEDGFLREAAAAFRAYPRLGAAGGRVVPEFSEPPPPWADEFLPLLALSNHGQQTQMAPGGVAEPYPAHAPVGAGLCVRSTAFAAYQNAVKRDPRRRRLDRRGSCLASGGDNDIVFTILRSGWDVGYFPSLGLCHLLPAHRLNARYLARLNRSIMRSWVAVLDLHNACPWPPIARWTVPARAARAFVRHRAWSGPAAWIRWNGALGQFLGQADRRQ